MPRRRECRAERPTRPAGGPSRHARADWLGGEQLAAWTNQTLVSEEAYAPFGEAYAGAGAGEQMFTGKGQRLAAGIYDFPFRHYSPAQGRWPSPDPAGLAAVNAANPQSWNAYAYVANQPLTATDPLGLGTITFKTVVSECITCVGVWRPSPWNLLSPTGGSASGGSAATAAAPATAAAQCPRGAGLALPVAASAEGGLGVTGAGAQTSALLGAFDSGAGGPSAGALQTGGAAAYFLGHSSGAPAQAGHQPFTLGAFAGITIIGGALTNAGSPSQLAGRTLNVGFGPQVTIQYASSPSGIWEFSISVGPGAGIDYSQYQTNTALRAGGGC